MIKLNKNEKEILARIELDARALKNHIHAQENGKLATILMNSLVGRGGIPKHRLSYFTDPSYNVGGRGSSRKDVFVRNGCREDEITVQPHFLAYLRYFIHGADLPSTVIAAFVSKVEECGHVTSSDIIPLGNAARDLARKSGLAGRDAREEFFMLALDCGLGLSTSASIRQAVSRLK